MKIDDIWKNGEQPDIRHQNPKDDKKRKGWMHEIGVIQNKAHQALSKLDAEGKTVPWDTDRTDIIRIKIHQSDTFRVVDNDEGQKIADWFNKLEQRRAQLAAYLLLDLDRRGPPHQYKKTKT